MIRTARWIGTATPVIALAAVLAAQTPVLDIKMGLWERTTTASSGPGIPPQTTVEQECLTKEQFEKDPFGIPPTPGATCRNTIKTNTRTVYDATVACTGDATMNADIHVEAESSTAYKATVKMTGPVQGQSRTISFALKGKWLGAACGTAR